MRGLAGGGGVAPDAEQIIEVLKGKAEPVAEGTEVVDLIRGAAAEEGAERARTSQQRTGFALGHVLAFGQVDVIATLEEDVLVLAVQEVEDSRTEPAESCLDGRVGAAGQDIEGEGHQGVTGQDREPAAEHAPRGAAVPAGGGP